MNKSLERIIMGYSRILAHYPYVVLATVTVFAMTCLVVIVTIGEWPDFTEPRLGFEARGTKIGSRLVAYDLLIENTVSDQIPSPQNFMAQVSNGHSRSASSLKPLPEPTSNLTSRHRTHLPYLSDEEELKDSDYEHGFYNSSHDENFFCDVPRLEYSRVVFAHKDGETLFTRENIHAMCHIENQYVMTAPSYRTSCIDRLSAPQCCHSWSLGNYIALLSNRTTCLETTESDVDSVYQLLKKCAVYYNNGTLKPLCNSPDMVPPDACRTIPYQCKQENAVYYILHYLTDMDFLRRGNLGGVHTELKYALTFLPLAAGISTKPIYEEIDRESMEYGRVQIIGINFGIKEDLFNYHLKRDVVWFAIAFLVIFLAMWLYTASLFLTAMTIISIFLSLEIAYFLYTMVYEVTFFPFKNLLAIVILLGIGADDVFIYCRVWTMAKLEKNAGTLEKIVSDTLKHATLSMFVTSLTTSAAFFANYVSNITALSCFALFAGTVVMVNFFIMVTWIPATIVIHEKWCSVCYNCYNPDFHSSKKGCGYYMLKIPHLIYTKITDWSRVFFEKILPCIIIRARYLWLVLLGFCGIAGIIIVFYYPKLKLPSSNDFQVFAAGHPFEVYDFRIKDSLWFEKAAGDSVAHMPLIIVWGAKAVDNGNKLDPYDEGTLEYDENFNIAAPESQEWLRSFCQKLRASEYYQWEHGLHVTSCFIDSFVLFMKRGCEGLNGERYEPCCGNPQFPYQEAVFKQCIQQWLPMLQENNPFYYVNPLAGVRFSKETGQLVAVIVQYLSNVPYSLNYDKMHEFYSEVDTWVASHMEKAPTTMRGGWFISDLEFYDLQESIAQGTPVAIGVSIAIATVVAFLTTLNIFLTIYAILTIAFAIFVTVGTLVLLGWELNILEAVTMSVAVGLSIDFPLHYGVAYRLSPDLDREMRVARATGRMGSPVAMASFTTFLAGALMMPSTVLAYRQLGIFLMIVMSVSWIYGTFFLQALLRCVGPQGGFGQLHWPSSDCCSGASREHVDKTVYAMSESTLSSSSTNHVNSSETHELEPLTDQERESSRRTSTATSRGRYTRTLLSDYSVNSLDTLENSSQPDTTSQHNSTLGHSSSTPFTISIPAEDDLQVNPDSEASLNLLNSCTKQNGLDTNRNSCGSVVWVEQSPAEVDLQAHPDSEASLNLLNSCTKQNGLDTNRNSCGSDVWVKQSAAIS